MAESPTQAQRVPVVLALDAQGGDRGPGITVPAAAAALRRDPALRIVAAGQPDVLEPLLSELDEATRRRITLAPADSVLDMALGPRAALRSGPGSSLWTALAAVADGRAAACVSAGNTAALLTLGRKLLGVIEHVERPALMSPMPTADGEVFVLDLGANLTVTGSQLVQFAVMGAVAATAMTGNPEPRIALLNVGHEESKGHAVIQEAHDALRTLPLNYQGFIEGHDLYAGKADVAVCDGFAGNLVLKSSEGAARLLFTSLRDALAGSWRSRLGAWLARDALRGLVDRFDPAAHNGAPLLGLAGVVVKSHGSADVAAMGHAIDVAAREARMGVPARIEQHIADFKSRLDPAEAKA